MGIVVNILRAAHGYDCTNGGPSAFFKDLTLVNVEGPFEPSRDAPAARLEKGHLPGRALIRPEALDGSWTMFGGNFAYSSDARFHEAVEALVEAPSFGAVPIHDRVEY